MVEGKSTASSSLFDSEMMVAEKVPATHHQVQLVVAKADSATEEKVVGPKGKEVSQAVSQPRAWKVMWVDSPLHKVSGDVPPIAGPSGML